MQFLLPIEILKEGKAPAPGRFLQVRQLRLQLQLQAKSLTLGISCNLVYILNLDKALITTQWLLKN